MTSFSARDRFAAAYNPLSSFRLLHSDAEADAHLRCVAAALRPGGVYVLDLAFLANAAEPVVTTDEGWEMKRGELTVRGENDAVYVTDAGVERRLAWGPEAHLRGYTASAFAERVSRLPRLRDRVVASGVEPRERRQRVQQRGLRRRLGVGRAMVVLRRKSRAC